MRHIKKNDLRARIKENWLNAAKAGLEELAKKKTRKERSKFIAKFLQDKAALWAELKQCMAQPVPAKCWYSEVQRALADLEIDHFRPKNAISGCAQEGYWWLAFDWENFRISSSLANKRRTDNRSETIDGKGTHFPLVDETKRVATNTAGPTTGERPMLLDPFNASDVVLLDYAVETGKVVEKFSEERDKVKHLRANRSIELYHLNEGTLIAQRAERAAVLKVKSDKIEKLFSRMEGGEALSGEEYADLEQLQNDMAEYINSNSEYSAFSRSFLAQLGSRGWNDELLAIT